MYTFNFEIRKFFPTRSFGVLHVRRKGEYKYLAQKDKSKNRNTWKSPYILYNKNIGLLSLDLLSLFQKSLGNNHLFHAVTADYVDYFSRSAAITAFRTDVFAGAAGLFSSVSAPLGKCAENI